MAQRAAMWMLWSMFALAVHGQANDNCANAEPIPISAGGYGTGTFSTAPVALNAATVQPGEFFSYAPLLAARSVWYRFTILTSRRVTLQLTTNGIGNASDVGWTCYRVPDPTACLPGYAQAQAAFFTPMQSTGSSIVGCLRPGEYLVQVSANSGVGAGTVTMNLTVEPSLTSMPYDQMATPWALGALQDRVWAQANLAIQCFGLESDEERCAALPGNTQSAWITFTTPADLVWLLLRPGYYGVYSLYEGDIATTPLAGLTPILDCVPGNGQRRIFLCDEIQPSTTYTLHVRYDENWGGNDSYAVMAKTSPLTNAPIPTNVEVDAPNQFGSITPASTASTITRSDAFACNAFIDANACGTLNSTAAQFLAPSNDAFPLACYFTFSLSANANVVLNATTPGNNNPAVRMRLLSGNVTGDCAAIDLDADALRAAGNYLTYNCLPAGDYTVQVLGNVDSTGNYLEYPNVSMLGFPVDLALTTTALPTTSFGLNGPGEAEAINGLADLVDHTAYLSTADTFSCANAPLPDGYTCTPQRSKVIYRTFTIGDANGDAVADSGLMVITGFSSQYYTNPPGWTYTPGQLYTGDAEALATAQGSFAHPQVITGLDQATGCLFYQRLSTTNGVATRPYKGCHRAGTYTHALFADTTMVGWNNRPTYEFRMVDNLYADPAAPEDIGDVIADGLNATSDYDTFTCTDNAVTIAGLAPCAPKAVYREFYLSASAAVNIQLQNWNIGQANTAGFRLFRGRSSDGLASLAPNTVAPGCTGNFNATECDPLPAGWYTVVTYGRGPNYDNNLQFFETNSYLYEQDSDIDDPHRIIISVDTSVTPGPLYNRPHKACAANSDLPIVLVDQGTPANPYYTQRFVLCTENFKVPLDTPITFPFCPGVTRTAYYVFTIAQESYVRIENPGQLHHFLFPFDVRTDDSLLLATATPLSGCDNRYNNLEYCRLQPGTYTVVYGAFSTPACFTFTPVLVVDRVQYSLHDFTNTAYDFGTLLPDSLFHDGSPGDVNLTYPGAAASADMIYCTTGAFASDPFGTGWGCGWPNNPNEVYPDGPDNGYYEAPGQQGLPTRNLWYTFATSGAGTFTVEVTSPTMAHQPGMRYPFFAVFQSDADGSVPYATLVANGEADSTLAQGLTLLAHNHDPWCNPSARISRAYLDDVCDTTIIHRRFHVVVYGFYPNQLVEVRVRWEPFLGSAPQPLYDHHVDANTIGSGLVDGPYPVVPLVTGDVVTGGWDSFFCASVDATDQHFGGLSACTQATLWYSFTVAQRSRVFVGLQNDDSTRYGILYAPDIQGHLFRELVPGDPSTSTGMQSIPWAQWAQVAPGLTAHGNCLEPGTYHLMLRNCNGQDTLLWRPWLWVLDNAGDLCTNPHSGAGAGAGAYAVTGSVTCHSIGEAYGEDGSDMGCLPGPDGWQSTWYRFNYTGTDTVDIAFAYTNNTTATQIARRVFYGQDCQAMTAGECNNNFVSVDVITCVTAATGGFLVQILTPEGTTGNATITFNVTPNSNDDCQLFDPSPVNANFTYVKDCDSDTVQFYNASTTGPAYTYAWDFGAAGLTSTAMDPAVLYPGATGTQVYEVSLTVIHVPTGETSVHTQEVTIDFERPLPDLGNDTTVCASVVTPWVLDATHASANATYSWQDNSTDPTFAASVSGTYWVDVTIGGCTARDSILLTITQRPVLDLGPDTTYCTAFSHLLSATSAAPATITWSNAAAGYSQTVTQPGLYWARATLGPCTVSDTTNIILYTAANTVLNETICHGTCHTLPDGSQACSTGPWPVTLLSAAGCDSTVVTNLVVSPPVTSSVAVTICFGESHQLPDGTMASTPGPHPVVLTSAAGCDSTVTTQLTIRPYSSSTTQAAICAGDSFILPDGSTANTEGAHVVTLVNSVGCDSVITTQLTILQHSSNTLQAAICAGDSFTLPDGSTANTAGAHVVTLVNSVGCDSVITTQLTILAHSSNTLQAAICAGDSFTLPDGSVANTAGDHVVTLMNSVGCDSVITTQLTILQHSSSTAQAAICAGDSFTLPDGSTANTAGAHVVTLMNSVGCDSVITTQLTILAHSSNTLQAAICAGDSFTLPDGSTTNTAGAHVVTLVNSAGCDSVITTQLTILAHSSNTLHAAICAGDSFTLPDGSVVTTAGDHVVTLANSVGCDSVITTQLVVHALSAHTITRVLCAGERHQLPNGVWVDTDGSYPVTLVNAAGCDSVLTTVVVVRPEALHAETVQLCDGDSYTLPDGQLVTAAGVYTSLLTAPTGCDSTITTTVQVITLAQRRITATICTGDNYQLPDGSSVSEAGTYPVLLPAVGVNGCDSLITVDLRVEAPEAAFHFTAPSDQGEDQLVWFHNDSQGAEQHHWDFGDGDTSDQEHPVHRYSALQAQTYVVCLAVLSPAQCVDTTCAPLDLDITLVHVPNSFTPNNDGHNEGFGPVFGGTLPDRFLFEVYDRWGQPLFSTQEPGVLWDGRFRTGGEVPLGVYVWKLTYTGGRPVTQQEKLGHVLLIR